MAKIRYKRVPERALVDLTDVDLQVLDLAFGALRSDIKNQRIILTSYKYEVLDLLQEQVRVISEGESEVEE